MDFKNFGINKNIIDSLNKRGITSPTPIQEETIIPIKEGKDVIAESQTGSGKTLAFLLPMFENINENLNQIQGLIISPTRELAIQITDEARKLSDVKNLNILPVYGGQDVSSQLKKLKKNPHIIVATPGRLIDHMQRDNLDLKKLKTIVIDEADQMLLMGFKNEVETIMKEVPKKLQTLCFSATISPQVKKLAYRYTKDPLVVSIQKEDNICLDNIKQFVVETTDRHKQECLAKALIEDNPFMCIIFCRTKRRADELEIGLANRGFKCEKLHGDLMQSKREKLMKSFRKCEIQYLIATDVAARGLDVSGVTHIYNYDIPETVESYIHRIGRTGRAGDAGYTCLFIDPKNNRMLESIEETIGFKIPRRNINL